MRTILRLGWTGWVMLAVGCGKSPVSVEDGQTLTHRELGYTISLPAQLQSDGWVIDADKEVSKYDLNYRFSFRPPNSDLGPPLLVNTHRLDPMPYTSALEWAKQQDPTVNQLQQLEVLEAITDTVVVAGVDVVETLGRWVAPQGNMLSCYYVAYIIHKDVAIQIDGSFNVGIGGKQTAEDLLKEYTAKWEMAVPKYRAIVQTLTFAAL